MKRLLLSLSILIFISLLLISCSSSVDTKITFKNNAMEQLLINFRGEAITVASGKTVEIKDVPRGLYDYNTTYRVPFGTVSSSVQGDVSGQVEIKAGTKILILFSSTFIDQVYTLYATKSSSDDLTVDEQTP